MRIFWEESDIKVGRRVGKSAAQEIWMIGYMPNRSDGDRSDGGNIYTLVSLRDGLIYSFLKTKQDVADLLNKVNDLPAELFS